VVYITNTSLDGYVDDETGAFDWVIPDQVHAFITELLRPIGTHLYGPRLYETMAYWDAPVEGYPPEHRDFARVWQKGEEIVFSRTLTSARTGNTRVERDFDLEAISKAQAGIGARHHHWRSRACGACARSRSGRSGSYCAVTGAAGNTVSTVSKMSPPRRQKREDPGGTQQTKWSDVGACDSSA
jgi:hypothetical protein